MTGASDRRCRGCRSVLGRVEDGTLRPLVPVLGIDRRGAATLLCPACHEPRVWKPAGCAAAVAAGGAA